MRPSPDWVTRLAEDEVFVFGSNLEGIHGGGAARQAWSDFGAERGVGEGLTGQCYAFPTLTLPSGWRRSRKLTREELEAARDRFFAVARSMPEKTFLLTRVGCGLAGFAVEEIEPLFAGAPPNVRKPSGWK